MKSMVSPLETEVTVLLNRLRQGDREAGNVLAPLLLAELHKIARRYMRLENPGHTLQPTALVNEAYVKLLSDERIWASRFHFIGVAANVMRRVLIDHARRRRAAKRTSVLDFSEQIVLQKCEEILALDAALDQLALLNERQMQIVELRYFGGCSMEETAQALNISLNTVRRDWLAAKVWLRMQVYGVQPPLPRASVA
jgi:RNA polymerase sigma-70 factor, ECF subfamily